MAYLKKYAASTRKDGFYIDGPSWTLQTTVWADSYFRDSNYFDDSQLPRTVVKTLVYLGEAQTEGRKSKEDMLDWFPTLNPEYCDMGADEKEALRNFVDERLQKSGLNRSEFEEFVRFLERETPIDGFEWSKKYAP